MSNLIKRFNQKYTEKESGCWIWTGSISPTGYGRITNNGNQHQAHRISYKIFNGEFDQSLFVCHKCDVRNCVNPNHLFLGTNQDNMIDMVKKGRNKNPRSQWTHCINGHPLSGDNLKVKTDGSRRCLKCLRKFERERSKKRRKSNDKNTNAN
jgi:hypothetical protein